MTPNAWDYPILAILSGIILTYGVATVLARGLARMGFPLPPARQRIGCIDGLRGYLALSVMCHHFVIWLGIIRLGGTWGAPGVAFFNQIGAGGVALFFMTTGLVFYPRVLAGFKATVWPGIFITRVFRIVPLILLSVALITTIIMLRTGNRPDHSYPLAALAWITTWGEVPLLNVPDSGRLNSYVLWTLWYEWLFYLLMLPACAFGMDLIRRRLPTVVLPLGILVATLTAEAALGDHAGLTLTFIPLFTIGMLAHEIAGREALARHLRSRPAAVLALAALGVSMIFIATPYTAALPAYGFFFLCVACGNDVFGVLRGPAALVLGECSYGIYLMHGTVLSLLFTEGAGVTAPLPTAWLAVLMPLAGLILTIITPITFLLVERPAIRLGKQVVLALTAARPKPGTVQ